MERSEEKERTIDKVEREREEPAHKWIKCYSPALWNNTWNDHGWASTGIILHTFSLVEFVLHNSSPRNATFSKEKSASWDIELVAKESPLRRTRLKSLKNGQLPKLLKLYGPSWD